MAADSSKNVRQAKRLVNQLIYPSRGFVKLAIVYGVAISLLTLAVPVAVQTLVNNVVNIASVRAVVILAILLFVTLAISGLLSALRTYTMEKYERHIYSRLTAEISVRTLMTQHSYFAGRRNVDIPNRYFDINIFQKNIPPLLIDGFALVLQLVVGFTLVSLYHPLFLVFCLLLVFILYLIWAIWSRKAIAAAVGVSHAKYATAKWLGDIASAHTFFKSGRRIEYAKNKTENYTRGYVRAHEKYFRYSFAQVVSLLGLYALASSTLLGLGGHLVIRGDLSIGQLVAAELILMAIFSGLSRAASYLKYYYELCGAADEIGMIFKMPINEKMSLTKKTVPCDNQLNFKQVEFDYGDKKYNLNFNIGSGEKVFLKTTSARFQKDLVNLLKSYTKPYKGSVRLGECDLGEFKNEQLNDPPIIDINKAPIVECTILEFMTLNAPDASLSHIHDVLERVGLKDTIHSLDDGIDTVLSSLGTPLQPHEFLLLKLAAAILVQPHVVILSQYFDNQPREQLLPLMKELEKEAFTVLYFSNMTEIQAFNYCLCLDQLRVKS